VISATAADTVRGVDMSRFGRTREERLAELGRDLVSAAFLRGDFVLSSGTRSRYYFDKYLFETRPNILRRIASLLAEMVPARVDRIAGPELGGVALATALSLEVELPFVIVKREAKAYGTARRVEGELHPGERVLVVEDVVTTGSQSIQAARQLVRAGAQVEGIVAVVDREQGGSENITAAGFHFDALLRRRDMGL
jgi:orotate phosphoribosyltransferase